MAAPKIYFWAILDFVRLSPGNGDTDLVSLVFFFIRKREKAVSYLEIIVKRYFFKNNGGRCKNFKK